MAKKRIGDLLIERGLITENELKFALDMQKQTHEKLGEVLVGNHIITPEDLAKTLAYQLEVDYIDLSKVSIPQDMAKLVGKNTARQNHLVPVQSTDSALYVAMDDPLNYYAIEEVRKVTKLRIIPLIATETAVEHAINSLYGNEGAMQAIEDIRRERSIAEAEAVIKEDRPPTMNLDYVISSTGMNEEKELSPTIRLVNSILERAVLERASDIHLEPREMDMDVRMRIDGVLQQAITVPKDITPSVIARIKTMAAIDVVEKRIPQDGRFAVSTAGKNIDVRVSTLPIAWGEKIVCRLLDKSSTKMTKEALGMTPEDLEKYTRLIHYHDGVVLLVGPTGSGKTTTMYAMLSELNTKSVNLVTLEDPIEYNINGLNQVQVNPKVNMTFASGLRAILRQDPDIVSVGEIRDGETAEIAIRAALTGRLVLSTIHTNDAVGAIERLEDIGVEPYLIASALRGVISQRLVRRICPHCDVEYHPDEEEQGKLGLEFDPDRIFHRGEGCSHCYQTGYSGRIAVFEIMQITPDIRERIYHREGRQKIQEALALPENGFVSLRKNAVRLVEEGTTTPSEALRIIYEGEQS